uniref:Shootin-1-like n=1 Tax=Diabrotica virgifera virgifera TaxID=50390 RepID=A0A6P7G5E5_DIAVI
MLAKLTTDIQEMKEEQKQYRQEIKELREENDHIKKENKDLKQKMDKMEERMDKMEKEKRRNNVIIQGMDINRREWRGVVRRAQEKL